MPASPLGPVPGLGYAELLSTHPLIKIAENSSAPDAASVAEEVPVAMVYNGEPFVVMMASPGNFEDLAFGFSVTEGIVSSSSDLRVSEVVKHSRGVEVQMLVSEDAAHRLTERRRGITARTGCGVCGIESIDEVLRVLHPVPMGGAFTVDALWRAAA